MNVYLISLGVSSSLVRIFVRTRWNLHAPCVTYRLNSASSKCLKYHVLIKLFYLYLGQVYNLTKSDNFATLGNPFTWTCSMDVPPGQTLIAVNFYRNDENVGGVGWISSKCKPEIANPRYILNCSAEHNFTLTIPAENMTEYEQHSKWRCQYYGNGFFKSSDITLNISSKIKLIFL